MAFRREGFVHANPLIALVSLRHTSVSPCSSYFRLGTVPHEPDSYSFIGASVTEGLFQSTLDFDKPPHLYSRRSQRLHTRIICVMVLVGLM